ncbi:MAG: NAD(P)-dependent oxidoreductase, partial [Rhizobiaceae bacterium]|nr:NAD(P)-dependent oxidoreductase [Rhizobiaceae bacterium]
MRYGFIGLGNLGAFLAGSLLREGFELTVNDLHKEVAKDLIARGAHWAETPAEVARTCDAVITCLPSPAAVDAVVEGRNGILEGAHDGLVWIDMSTSDRHDVGRLVKLAEAKGVVMLEAPVTGGVHRAAAGQITVLVGGDAALFEAHRPAFEAMGGKVLHMGPLGSASVIKVITNMLAFIHLVACGE